MFMYEYLYYNFYFLPFSAILKGRLHYMILSGRLCHTLQIMQRKLCCDSLLHSHAWFWNQVLFPMAKSCHFSQSTCRSLRLMSFQEKQEQGYTFSIHIIWFCRVAAQMCGLKWQRNSMSLVSNYVTRNCFSIWAASWQKQQNDLCARPVWPVFAVCQWVAKDPNFLHADSEDSDQTGWMPRLIWVFAGRILILLVLLCCGTIK